MGSEMELDRIVRKPELLEIVGVSIATVYRWIKDGEFPQPVKLGPNAVGWRASEVAAWLQSRQPSEPWGAEREQLPRKERR